MTRNYGFLPGVLFNRPDKKSLSDCSELGQKMPDPCEAFLWRYVEKATGTTFSPRDQGATPSCVGQSTATGVDILSGVSIAGLGRHSGWRAFASAESIYALSRYEIGTLKHGYRFRGGGSFVRYAAQAVKEYGCLAMMDYGEYDLSNFDAARCRAWGDSGLPDSLEPSAKSFVIRAFTPVKNVEECVAALESGFPVVIGSDVGFKGQTSRDDDGFLKPSGSWMHAQVYIGCDTRYSRPGILCQNSWGRDWLKSANARHEIPDGSYWVDLDAADRIIKGGEAMALSQFSGFAKQNLDFRLI